MKRGRQGAAAVLASCLVVAVVALVVPAVWRHGVNGDAAPPLHRATPTTSPLMTVVAARATLVCPTGFASRSYRGPATLAAGATSARLCGGGPTGATPPLDLLTTGLDRLVDSVDAQPMAVGRDTCLGPLGDRWLLLLAYPDGSERRVVLDFSGCGSIAVGGASRLNPVQPYAAFLRLVRDQRQDATPPSSVPTARCLRQNSGFSPLAHPADMVAARLCVSYDGGASGTTSVAVPAEDLETILDAWGSGPRTPEQKGPGCGPTTPTWVLSGVTRWGDPVQVTAQCDRPTSGGDWVDLGPRAQQVVDRLVARAGVRVDDGSTAPTAWALASAWLGDANAHAIAGDRRTAAAEVARVANSLCVRDPWLPEGELDWDLLGASRTEAAGWQQAWRVPVRTPGGQAVFVVVRRSNAEPWRILSLSR